ncbi:MAG: heptosyltransferase family protein [Acidobacteria bacterium OLB17]|nr:MAG: heptosyltransferase family protein [Acidobacteria bacterium OLB17]MCZ2392200.1 glycosyltransferase family 9 protein [Acidobacteriota bacterium]
MRIGHLGDTLVALPAFWALRKRFPEARLTLLSNFDKKNPHYLAPKAVLPPAGLFDRFIDYPTNVSASENLFGVLQLCRKIRSSNFDAVFYLMPRARAAKQIARDRTFFRMCGCRTVFGLDFTAKNSLAGPIPAPTPEITSESSHLLALLNEAGIEADPDDLSTELLLSEAEEKSASDFLSAITLNNGAPLVGIAPGSKWPSKVWFEERYAEVVARLIDAHDVLPIVLGGPEDRESGDRLIDTWGRGLNGAGKLQVRESAAVLRRCSLYLGNDTGTMHLAAAVGVRCAAIFAAIDYPGRWTPFGTGHAIFRRQVECEGCHTPDCFNDNICLKMVTVNEVAEAASMILSQESSRRG